MRDGVYKLPFSSSLALALALQPQQLKISTPTVYTEVSMSAAGVVSKYPPNHYMFSASLSAKILDISKIDWFGMRIRRI
jgi:hypothetical protein